MKFNSLVTLLTLAVSSVALPTKRDDTELSEFLLVAQKLSDGTASKDGQFYKTTGQLQDYGYQPLVLSDGYVTVDNGVDVGQYNISGKVTDESAVKLTSIGTEDSPRYLVQHGYLLLSQERLKSQGFKLQDGNLLLNDDKEWVLCSLSYKSGDETVYNTRLNAKGSEDGCDEYIPVSLKAVTTVPDFP